MSQEFSRPQALRVRTVRGDPIFAGGRELIPVARVISFGRASATVGSGRVAGRGGGFAWVKPLAVLEVTEAGERRIDLRDESAEAVRGILAAAVAIGLLCTVIRWLVHRRHGGSYAAK